MTQMKAALLVLCLLLAFPVIADDKESVRAQVLEAYIDMRTGPGRGSPIFYVAERGERVEVLKQRTDWLKVRNDRGIEGWVHVDQMALTRDQNNQPLDINLGNRESYLNRKWEIGTQLGDFGGADLIQLYVVRHFTENLSLEASYSNTFGKFSDGSAASMSLVHQVFPDWWVSPFVAIGGSIRKTEPRSTFVTVEDRVNDSLHVGVGFRVYITRHLLFRFQYNHHTILTNRDDDKEVEEWTIGLSTFF